MTDAAFMLAVLEGGPATTMQIISRSIAERGCGLTPHSRASELRASGYHVVCVRDGQRNGRPVYTYHLEALNEPGPTTGSGSPGSLSASSPSTTTEPNDTRCAQPSGLGLDPGLVSGMAPAQPQRREPDEAMSSSSGPTPVQLELIAS